MRERGQEVRHLGEGSGPPMVGGVRPPPETWGISPKRIIISPLPTTDTLHEADQVVREARSFYIEDSSEEETEP